MMRLHLYGPSAFLGYIAALMIEGILSPWWLLLIPLLLIETDWLRIRIFGKEKQ